MQRRDILIGDYTAAPCFAEKNFIHLRNTMVKLIEELHLIKGYRELTLFLAVNIADKFLALLARRGQTPPRIISLAVSSLLLAVKFNEPICPNLRNMVVLIN